MNEACLVMDSVLIGSCFHNLTSILRQDGGGAIFLCFALVYSVCRIS